MNDTILSALVVYSVGCIVPTQLDRESTPPDNPPVWVPAQVSPPFGSVVVQSKDSAIQFNLAAFDADLGDTLTAQAFLLTPPDNSLQFFNEPAILTLPTVMTGDPFADGTRHGNFEPFRYCATLNQGTYLLYAYVSDRGFIGNTASTNGGLTDSNHWELTCP